MKVILNGGGGDGNVSLKLGESQVFVGGNVCNRGSINVRCMTVSEVVDGED